MKKISLLLLFLALFFYPFVIFANDISELSYSGDYYDIGSYGLTVSFSVDGTKMYRSGTFGSNLIYQYNLSTPWDITSASANGSKAMSSNGITGIYFKTDGTKVYVVHFYSGVLYQYSLSTPWDITTASYDSVAKSLLTGNHYTFTMKQDGTAIYAVNSYSHTVKQFNLSSAWDLSTVSATANATLNIVSSGNNYYKNGAAFSSDGTKLYLVTTASNSTGATLEQYNLSTPWDVSTGVLNGTDFDLTSQSNGMRGAFVDSNDNYLFTYGESAGNYKIFKYLFELPDTEDPTVSITNPEEDDYVSGEIDLTASATDDVELSNVQFYIDDEVYGDADTESPYSISLDTTSLEDGEHTVYAIATDTSDNEGTSSAITFNVLNSETSFSNISSETNEGGVTISWDSNIENSSQVNYGLDSGVSNSTSETDTSAKVLSHSKTISNLEPCTDYYYQVRGQNNLSEYTESTILNFKSDGCRNTTTGSSSVSRINMNNNLSQTKEVDHEETKKIIENENSAPKEKFIFNKNLRPQMTDKDVYELQKFLNNNGFILSNEGVGSPGNETDYFGTLTQNALIKFQNNFKKEILEPINIEEGTGVFGEMTREFVNQKY